MARDEVLHPACAPFWSRKRVLGWSKDAGTGTPVWTPFGTASTFDAVGTNQTAGGGSNDGTGGPVEMWQTAATTGDAVGRISSAAITQRRWSPTATFFGLTAASSSNLANWIALTDADLSGIDSPTTQTVAGLRYSTGAGDNTAGAGSTAAWACVTCDGGGTPTITTGAHPFTINQVLHGMIEIDDAASAVRFWLESTSGLIVPVATHTTSLPGSSTGLKAFGLVQAKANTLKRFSLGWFAVAMG